MTTDRDSETLLTTSELTGTMEPSSTSAGDSACLSEHAMDDDDRITAAHENVHESTSGEKRFPLRPSKFLDPSFYIIGLVLAYSGLTLFSWIVVCISSQRPIKSNMTGYGMGQVKAGYYAYGRISARAYYAIFLRSETWYRATRITQAIVSVLAIPLTSAVCATTAVVIAQGGVSNNRLTLRQMLVLADKGWMDPTIWVRLVSPSGWRKYGTTFLLLTIALNILGAVIAPSMQAFLTTAVIKVPTWPQLIPDQVDIMDHFPSDRDVTDNNLVTVLTRGLLASTSVADSQSRLWEGNASSCAVIDWNGSEPVTCANGGTTFADIGKLKDPFLAQLPSSFSTGVIRQYAPRINSSVQRRAIDATTYPKDCEHIPGAFHVHHAGSLTFAGNWSLTACMPGNMTESPWKGTRTRQDFGELLYLNITVCPWRVYECYNATYQITANTTAGYFELPNYMNEGKPGPLIEGDPMSHCGADCGWQFFGQNADRKSTNQSRKRQGPNVNDTTESLEHVVNKGPLLTTAMALFGKGSFIQERVARLRDMVNETSTGNAGYNVCAGMAPMQGLWQLGPSGTSIKDCVRNDVWDTHLMHVHIQDYLLSFVLNLNGDEVIENGFHAAVFLANEVWLLHPPETLSHSFGISYDLGADLQIPVISMTGIILVSTLIGIFLSSVLSMALYAAWKPQWTQRLDAFSMMRIGASISADLPMDVASEYSSIRVLDEIPGYVGDATEGQGRVGKLALGADTPLRRHRRYRCYVGDHKEPWFGER